MDPRKLILFFGALAGLLLLSGCNREPAEPAETAVVAPTALPPATATPPPETAVSLIRPTMTPLPTRQEPALQAAAPVLQAVNDWLEWFPPAGWQVAVGPDGAIASPDPGQSGAPMLLIRRWSSPVDLSGWQAYLPQAAVETNGHAAIELAGRSWDGVFITCPDYTCRAFFATSRSGSPAFSLLVLVPTAGEAAASGAASEALYALWDSQAPGLNATLQTLQIHS